MSVENNVSDQSRSAYGYFSRITTRWNDNDIYGHINNVRYYSYFDSVANQFLIEQGGLNIHEDEVVGYVVASNCLYHSPIAYPQILDVGFRANKIGSKSVEYGLAIFKQGKEAACANGTFTHVFVNRETGKSVLIPDQIRSALDTVLIKK